MKILFPHLCFFIANSIYAINYIFAKDVMPDFLGPNIYVLLRETFFSKLPNPTLLIDPRYYDRI